MSSRSSTDHVREKLRPDSEGLKTRVLRARDRPNPPMDTNQADETEENVETPSTCARGAARPGLRQRRADRRGKMARPPRTRWLTCGVGEAKGVLRGLCGVPYIDLAFRARQLGHPPPANNPGEGRAPICSRRRRGFGFWSGLIEILFAYVIFSGSATA